MRSKQVVRIRVGVWWVLCLGFVTGLRAGPLRHAGNEVEVSLARVSDYAIEVKLVPLGQQDGEREPASTVLVDVPCESKWSARELSEPAEVTVGRLRCEISPRPLTLAVYGSGGKLTQRLVWGETEATLEFGVDAPVFGLGEGALGFDRRGKVYPMQDGWGAADRPICGSRISVPFLIGADGWALFLPDLPGQKGEFDLRGPRGVFRGVPAMRVFLIVADEPKQILAQYSELIGRAPIPPKWTMGYMQSHRTLAGPNEVLQEAQAFREKQLPCDALIYLGTGYCPTGWNMGHGSLEFNLRTFDRPQQMIQQLHDRHFKVVLHVNHAPRGLHGLSMTEASDNPLHIRNYWARHSPVYALGVDGWWPDDGDELPQEARLARHRCYYEGPLLDKPNIRPWSLHRTGCAGVQRYGGWIWSGDPESRWATLAAHVAVGLNHSLSLSPFWGSDIGGFVPTPELTGELYVRWFQFGAFCPIFRSHGRTWHLRLPWGWNTGEYGPVESPGRPDESELHNAAVEPICREYLNLRYRLLPYNYTLAREAHDTGMPMMRAMWLHYPADPQAAACGDQYLWGRDILVAPVVTKGVAQRSIYLPAGNWYDWWTGGKISGGRTISRTVNLATLPLYVRAGAILPLDPVRQYIDEPVGEPTTLRIYTGADGEFTLYDDDGKSLDYLRDAGTWTRMTWREAERRLSIEPDARMKGKPLPSRTFSLVLLPGEVRKAVTCTGERVEVDFQR
jgi:alpha-glucosidase (family GH31 glycosyl hydrolase)